MIKTFRSKGLDQLHATGRSKHIAPAHQARCLQLLSALAVARVPRDMAVPGFDFHPLKGHSPIRYAVSVNGPWRITFAFEDGDVVAVDYEQYH